MESTVFENAIPSDQSLICENCKAEYRPDQIFCSSCSFPVNGTEQEKTSFRLTLSSRRRLLADANEKLKGGKTALYVLAGLSAVTGVILFLTSDSVADLITYLVIALIYLVLSAWFDRNPFGAMLTGLILYGTLQLVIMFVDPASLFKGIIIKAFVIAAFVKGIRSSLDAQRLLKELEKLKAV